MYGELESREGEAILGLGNFPLFKSKLDVVMERGIYFLTVETPKSAGRTVGLPGAICLVLSWDMKRT